MVIDLWDLAVYHSFSNSLLSQEIALTIDWVVTAVLALEIFFHFAASRSSSIWIAIKSLGLDLLVLAASIASLAVTYAVEMNTVARKSLCVALILGQSISVLIHLEYCGDHQVKKPLRFCLFYVLCAMLLEFLWLFFFFVKFERQWLTLIDLLYHLVNSSQFSITRTVIMNGPMTSTLAVTNHQFSPLLPLNKLLVVIIRATAFLVQPLLLFKESDVLKLLYTTRMHSCIRYTL